MVSFSSCVVQPGKHTAKRLPITLNITTANAETTVLFGKVRWFHCGCQVVTDQNQALKADTTGFMIAVGGVRKV